MNTMRTVGLANRLRWVMLILGLCATTAGFAYAIRPEVYGLDKEWPFAVDGFLRARRIWEERSHGFWLAVAAILFMVVAWVLYVPYSL